MADYKNAALRCGFFFALVDGPRKNSHSAAEIAVAKACRAFALAGLKPPTEVVDRLRGLQAAEVMEEWATEVWEQAGSPAFPQTRAECEALAVRAGIDSLI